MVFDDLLFYYVDPGVVLLVLHHQFHEGLLTLLVCEPPTLLLEILGIQFRCSRDQDLGPFAVDVMGVFLV